MLEFFIDKFNSILGNQDSSIPMEEYFHISIGKTPPRKESYWFSRNRNDVKWVSIADMGDNDVFISESSEFLTTKAVEKFNIVQVPDNAVIMSFKLTVGRISITDGILSTNEAIAHFKSHNKELNEYLYCYLTYFNFQNLGSTSSIATAINSKIIKNMPFILPDNDSLNEFHNFAYPLFQLIKTNLRENKKLKNIRDALLPKLISGELDISQIDI